MPSVSVERRKHIEALEQGLESVLQQLKAVPEVRKILLFGSYATGRRDLFTDLDLLVVMDSPLGFVERTAELSRRLRTGVALDLLVYTPNEMERMGGRPFLRHAQKTGKVLYEREPKN